MASTLLPVWAVIAIGFVAQALFSARIVVQWAKSEREGKLVSPSWYWILSLAGSWVMFIYGVLRNDFSIIVGQLIAYYIYIWNLDSKDLWRKVHPVLRFILLLTPALCVGYAASHGSRFAQTFLTSDDMPLWLLLFGTTGQALFSLRFIYQYFLSRKVGESVMPTSFWVVSLLSAAMIVVYGIFRSDIVLIIGQGFGVITYSRNVWIGYSASRKEKDGSVGGPESPGGDAVE